MKQPDSNIVADGVRRLREAANARATRQQILEEITQRHASDGRNVYFWGRLWLAVKIRREVAAEMRRRFPPGALYVAANLP